MLSIPIHKDVASYEPKIVAGMTGRTLVFTVLAVVTAAVTGIIIYAVLGQDPTSFPWMLFVIVLPMGFWLLGYQRPLGLKFEEFASLWVRHRFFKQRLLYASSDALGRGPRYERLARECHAWDADAGKRTHVTESYAKLRKQQGIELWQPGE